MPTLYTEAEYTAIRRQKNQRWLILLIPVVLLLALLAYSLVIRLQVLTSLCTILVGAILVAGYDLAIKPLRCYQNFLHNALHGRSRTCELPFLSLSEDVNLVEGVNCRSLFCEDIDGKGRPYERLFYFDALKTLPDIKPGQVLRIVHHDLFVSDVSLV